MQGFFPVPSRALTNFRAGEGPRQAHRKCYDQHRVFRANRRQPLPYRITEGLPVIRPGQPLPKKTRKPKVKTTEVKVGSPHPWSWVMPIRKLSRQLHANWDGLFK